MRIVVLGGTRFIGRALLAELVTAKHEVLVVHRGQSEPSDLPLVEHVHAERRDQPALRGAIAAFRAEALVDTCALTRHDAESTLAALERDLWLLVLSSMDVYRAYGSLLAGRETDPVPLDETSPVRAERFPYRGKWAGMDDYEKLDVEDNYLRRGATVARLPMVYGEHDGQRREEFMLRRVRANRDRIPCGAGNWLWSRGYVGEIARGLRLALEVEAAAGQVVNFCEARTASVGLWARQILVAAGAGAELVRVDESLLPGDLRLTATVAQHLLVDPAKARALLGWSHSDPVDAIQRSVSWHLAHPPDLPADDFAADDRALAAATLSPSE